MPSEGSYQEWKSDGDGFDTFDREHAGQGDNLDGREEMNA